ncbi:MAG: MarR family transcriptional regulator [Thiobacillus sp.]|nr:MarR family transcriptional regulator [Thiobacillus sp.]
MADGNLDPLELHRNWWPETYDDLVLPLVLALYRARERQRHAAEAVMARHGLAPAEFDVLATLRRAPPPGELTPSDIQQAMFITSGGLTKVLRQLELRGLVVRSVAPADRRSKPVRLKPKAVHLIERAMAELMAELNVLVHAGLAEAEIGELTRLLGKLAGPR